VTRLAHRQRGQIDQPFALTGGSGDVGARLMDALLERGIRIQVMTRHL
jgi:uncharacterized protein YbjT (DUF2867 family)